jgi:hypothetical protein
MVWTAEVDCLVGGSHQPINKKEADDFVRLLIEMGSAIMFSSRFLSSLLH